MIAGVENVDCEAHEVVVAAFDTAANITRVDFSTLIRTANSEINDTANDATSILFTFNASVVNLTDDIEKARESYMDAIAPDFFLVGGDTLKEQVQAGKNHECRISDAFLSFFS